MAGVESQLGSCSTNGNEYAEILSQSYASPTGSAVGYELENIHMGYLNVARQSHTQLGSKHSKTSGVQQQDVKTHLHCSGE